MGKKKYVRPELVAFSCKPEIGYAGSIGLTNTVFNIFMLDEMDKSIREMESFENHDVWKDDNGNSFWD